MNAKILVQLSDRYDKTNHKLSDAIDNLLIKIAQQQEQNSTNEQETQQYDQPINNLPIYGIYNQYNIPHSPYMQYFLIPSEKLFANMVNAGYNTQQAYQYSLGYLNQLIQSKQVPQQIARRIYIAFNDWVKYNVPSVSTQQNYTYQQLYPIKTHITTRRQTPYQQSQYGRTRFFR